MSSALEVKNLNFDYGEGKVLHNINLKVERGSFYAIIGPNGSGKSTLLKNMSKAVMPCSGEIWLDSLNLLKLKPSEVARRMAVVPQGTHIDFPFTVHEAVLMGRTPFLKKFQNENARDFALTKWAMEITNTWYLKDRPITEVSGGELQRAVVARALAQEPRILLLDEPTAHLDIQHQMELLELLTSLNKTTGLTVVAVLHDLNLAAQFSEQVVLMREGEIFAVGEPQEVLTPENIKTVYEVEVALTDNPLTGRFNVIPLGRSKRQQADEIGLKLHIICGGGTGSFIMDKLVQLGHRVSCGVLNIGDTDWSRAKMLGLEVIEEAPFAPISKRSLDRNRSYIEKTDCVIITAIPFGKGNIPNLELALDHCKKGNPLIVIEDESEERDFSGGRAREIMEEIKRHGGFIVNNSQAVFDCLNEVKKIKTNS